MNAQTTNIEGKPLPQLDSQMNPLGVSKITGNSLLIGACSMRVGRSARMNSHAIVKIIEDNPELDWLAFPECALSGYGVAPVLNNINAPNTQETIDGLKRVEMTQRELETGLVLGTSWVEKDGMPYNQARIYDKFGFRGAYNKQLLTTTFKGGGEANAWSKGWENTMFFLDDMKTRRAGVLICNDFFAHPFFTPKGDPYLMWQLARDGVGLVFVISNTICRDPGDWDQINRDWTDVKLRMFARTTGMWIVASNACPEKGEGSNFTSPTGIVNPQGEWVARLEDNTVGVVSHLVTL
jgi:predicted amidohydrolase